MVVDNKGGAGGNIAHQFAKAPTDGSVLLFGSIGPLTIAPHIMKVATTLQRSRAHLGRRELPQCAGGAQGRRREESGRVRGQGQEEPRQRGLCIDRRGLGSHLAGELFNQRAGVEMVHVPYKGAPALQDLLGERVTSYFAAPPTALPHIETGKLIRWPPPA